MQIEKVQSPNFGALKITRPGVEFLKSSSMKDLEFFKNAGKILENHKHWDLEIVKNGLRAKSKDFPTAFLGGFRPADKPVDSHLFISTIYDGNSVTGPKGQAYKFALEYANAKDALTMYERLDSMNESERAVAVVSKLEEQTENAIRIEAEREAAGAAKDREITDLIMKYGQ